MANRVIDYKGLSSDALANIARFLVYYYKKDVVFGSDLMVINQGEGMLRIVLLDASLADLPATVDPINAFVLDPVQLASEQAMRDEIMRARDFRKTEFVMKLTQFVMLREIYPELDTFPKALDWLRTKVEPLQTDPTIRALLGITD